MTTRKSYPTGVPCWVDVVQGDVDATMAFYGDLFGWTFQQRTPPGVPQRYAYAYLDGAIVAGVGGPPVNEAEQRGWTTYVRVESADATVDRAVAAGGTVLVPPVDVGPPGRRSGRPAVLADPAGAAIGVWEAGETEGVEAVNVPGSWNFSDLHVGDVGAVERFYADVFGWQLDALDMGGALESGMWRLPGYGDFLAADDPAIRERQASGPDGFADAVALLRYAAGGGGSGDGPSWGIVFAVADATAAVERATTLGATVVEDVRDTHYTRVATVRDPQGAVVILSQYRPPA